MSRWINVTNMSAVYVSDTIPGNMTANQSYKVTVTMLNNGTTPPISSTGILFASLNGSSSVAGKYFNTSAYAINSGVVVFPGQPYTFNFTMKAPATKSVYYPVFQMELVGRFCFGVAMYKTVKVS